jgi:hypothetical protein
MNASSEKRRIAPQEHCPLLFFVGRAVRIVETMNLSLFVERGERAFQFAHPGPVPIASRDRAICLFDTYILARKPYKWNTSC